MYPASNAMVSSTYYGTAVSRGESSCLSRFKSTSSGTPSSSARGWAAPPWDTPWHALASACQGVSQGGAAHPRADDDGVPLLVDLKRLRHEDSPRLTAVP